MNHTYAFICTNKKKKAAYITILSDFAYIFYNIEIKKRSYINLHSGESSPNKTKQKKSIVDRTQCIHNVFIVNNVTFKRRCHISTCFRSASELQPKKVDDRWRLAPTFYFRCGLMRMRSVTSATIIYFCCFFFLVFCCNRHSSCRKQCTKI